MKNYEVTYDINHKVKVFNMTFKEWKTQHMMLVEADSFYEAKQIVKSKVRGAKNLQAKLLVASSYGKAEIKPKVKL